MNSFLTASLNILVFTLSAFAQENTPSDTYNENKFSWGIENDLSSRNFYQGMIISKAEVTQPSIWISYHDFTFTEWSNVLLSRKDGRGVDETELILDYEHEFKNLTLAPTLTLYYFPKESSDRITSDINLKIAYKIGVFSLFTNNLIDFATFAGAYYGELGGLLSFDFSKKFNTEVKATISWASPYYNEVNWKLEPKNGWALNSFSAEIFSTYYIFDFLYLKPHIGAVTVINKRLKKAAYSESTAFGGLLFGLEF